MSDRVHDLDTISGLREAREGAVRAAQQKRLADVFGADGPARQVYVVKLLDVHPSLGKVAGRRLLDSLSISHVRRVHELSHAEKSAILAAVGEA